MTQIPPPLYTATIAVLSTGQVMVTVTRTKDARATSVVLDDDDFGGPATP